MNQEKYEQKIVNELFDEMIDDIEFEKSWEDYKVGKSPVKIHIPTYAEVKDSLMKKVSEKSPASENILQKAASMSRETLEQLNRWVQINLGSYQNAAAGNPELDIEISWNGEIVTLRFWKTDSGFEVLTPEPKVIGKLLIIRFSDQTVLTGEFFEDEVTLEGMKASAFFKKEGEMNFDQLIAAELEE